MLSWLQTQANRGVLFVGFCELNGWQDLESYTDLFKNRPKIAYRAANAGFPYSHVMVNTQVHHAVPIMSNFLHISVNCLWSPAL